MEWSYATGARLCIRSLSAVLLCASVGACGAGQPAANGAPPSRTALERYLADVEPIRLGVNRLLEGADPILSSLHDHRVNRTQAVHRMSELERRFADFTVEIAAVNAPAGALARLHREYAWTYDLEDAYLSALVSGLAQGEFNELPHTQAEQRAAIVRWRTGLTVFAREVRLTLPPDLQQAGRGEIAPSPVGAS
jgi:hypothetical protein